MKLKLLFLALLLPLTSFGATTNKIDNLWIPSSIRITAGVPAVGKALVSDAAGFGTWTVIPTGFDPATNWFSGGYATFNSGLRSTASSSNLFYYLQTTNINFGAVSGSPDGNMYWDDFNNWIGMDFLTINRPSSGTGSLYIGNSGLGGSQINATPAGILGVNYVVGQEFHVQSGATFKMVVNDTGTTINGNLSVTNNTILGSAAVNTITINGVAIAIPNGVNFGSGILTLPPTSSGTTTSGVNTRVEGTLIVTNRLGVGLSLTNSPGTTIEIASQGKNTEIRGTAFLPQANGLTFRTARGTLEGGPTNALLNNDGMGTYLVAGWDGVSTYRTSGFLAWNAVGNWTPTNAGTKLSFVVTRTNTVTTFTAMTLNSEGFLGIFTNTPAQMLHVNGNVLSKTNFSGVYAVGSVPGLNISVTNSLMTGLTTASTNVSVYGFGVLTNWFIIP